MLEKYKHKAGNMMIDTDQLRVVNTSQKLERKVESGKMSPEFLREHCRKNDLYMIPKFNTILYLHHKVICSIPINYSNILITSGL